MAGRAYGTVEEKMGFADVRAAHDVIIVGGRCAGSPTPTLLARKGDGGRRCGSPKTRSPAAPRSKTTSRWCWVRTTRIGAICRSMDSSTRIFVHTAGLRRHQPMTD